MSKSNSNPFFLFRNWSLYPPQIETIVNSKEIPKALKDHLKSLRVRPDSQIEISDGKGKVFTYGVEKPDFTLKFLKFTEHPKASPHLSLFLSPPRGDSFWDSMAFATQLGCHEVFLVESDFGEFTKKAPRADVWERLQRVVDSASESCRRPWAVEFPKKDWLKWDQIENLATQFDYFFVCNEFLANKKWGGFEGHSVKKQSGNPKIGILIGPEGGWSQQEDARFKKNPVFKPLVLGSQILKVPVAVCSALTLCNAYFEQK